MINLTKKDIQDLLSVQTKELKDFTIKQNESLARMVANGFKSEREFMDKRFNEVIRMLDVRKEVDELKTKMHKVYDALNL